MTAFTSTAPLRLLILGAHPDDAEFHAGGLATRYRRLGHDVRMVSVTDGRAGHFSIPPHELVVVRRGEARAAAALIGAESETWDFPDGELLPTLEVRWRIIAAIRQYRPDLVLTHRTNDYHPDHRAVGQAVQDAAYMVTVPRVVPDVPPLPCDPVIAFLPDRFTKPCRLSGDVVLDVAVEFDTIVALLAAHRSQFFEWLPFNRGILDQVPTDEAGKLAMLRAWYADHLRPMADRYRPELIAEYGPAHGAAVEFAEVYEISEYGTPADEAARRRLFPR